MNYKTKIMEGKKAAAFAWGHLALILFAVLFLILIIVWYTTDLNPLELLDHFVEHILG